MLEIILRILSILGQIFLILFIFAVVSILLVLFFPVTYRISGSRQDEGLKAAVKARWLFGLVRARYQYPDPGHIIAKVICFTLYDKKFPAPKSEDAQEQNTKKRVRSGKAGNGGEEDGGSAAEEEGSKVICADEGQGGPEDGSDSMKEQVSSADGDSTDEGQAASAGSDSAEDAHTALGKDTYVGKFFQKIEKIKYTIRSICDKIKEIWENISYYIELLQKESPKELFADTFFKVGKILKCIRPRHIKAELLFGTGSPDTTGYAYGVYCMLSPFLNCDKVCVTPDFENAALKGEMEISGHVTLGFLLINVLRLILDKRLKKFVGKIKAGRKDSKKDSV